MLTAEDLSNPERLGFDPTALKAKYREERDKRLRDDGNEQYIEVAGDFSNYVDDPYIDNEIDRDAIVRETEVVVVGGGFGGLLAGARLREAGYEDICVIEKGGDFGGTWYWNRYPGAMCDVESYIYFPLLEEIGYIPSEKYAQAPEILEYSKQIARHFDLYRGALLQTEVTAMNWLEDKRRWLVETNRGDQISARFVAMSNGPLNRPKLPGIPGINDFKGHTFHTSRWDYAYTGGSPAGQLDGLKDKRVGIIGTGATAIQCIPHLGASAAQLYVFQRTPSSVDVRDNRPTDPDWAASLEPGWQQRRMDNFNVLVSGGFEDEDMVADGWTEIFRNLTGILPPEGYEHLPKEHLSKASEIADFQKMEKVRGRVDRIVKDTKTAEALKPYYRQFCKRPCFHDEYLDTYNRSTVELIDTRGHGVERLTEKGVVVDGVEYEVDCLIFATGFEVGTSYTRRSGYDVIGANGTKLSEKWREGAETLHGLHSHDFPNCFFMGLIQNAITPNLPHMLNEQAKLIAYVMGEARSRGATRVEATAEAEAAYCGLIKKLAKLGEKFFAECTPGYYNNEGQASSKNGLTANSYGAGPVEFFKMIDAWRESDDLEGLELR